MLLQPTAITPLTLCLTPGVHFTLVAITRVVAGPKSKAKTKPFLESKSWQRVGLPVGPGVTVGGDPAKCGASRWSAMGVRGLTTQNHFGLDRDRPSHGSRDREGVGAVYFSQLLRLRLSKGTDLRNVLYSVSD